MATHAVVHDEKNENILVSYPFEMKVAARELTSVIDWNERWSEW